MSECSRRNFLKAVATVAATNGRAYASDKLVAGPRIHQPPGRRLERISDNLFFFRDTCNVFLLKDADRGVLIDFGSGAVLDHLGEVGITKVDWIFHTHHHRDQCQGDDRAVAARVPIAVPAHEWHYFADAENFWRNRRIFHLYDVANDFFTVTRDIPIERTLRDYEAFRWGPYDLFVLPSPAHTLGSITLLTTVDRKKVAFSGDLIHSPGKVKTLYDLQYSYGTTDGIDFAVHSLTRLREMAPELVCPSHGEPFSNPDAGLDSLITRLSRWYYFYGPRPQSFYGQRTLTINSQLKPITPHLVAGIATTSSFYAILSDSGKALFIDYGSAGLDFYTTFRDHTAVNNRIRFVMHSIPELTTRYGMRSIDVAMPSHMHDDHLNGFPYLREHHGTRVWCYENMKEVLEKPRSYNLGCAMGKPIMVDRTFGHEEKFRWEEYDFTVTHAPGHTHYQMALFVTIDGRHTAFTGDNWLATPPGFEFPIRHNVIYRNYIQNGDHAKSIERILKEEPEWLAPGHGEPYRVTRSMLDITRARVQKQQEIFQDLIADERTSYGLDPSWASIYPYQIVARRGESTRVQVRVRNYRVQPSRMLISLELPSHWISRPEEVYLEVPALAVGTAEFNVSIPRDWPAYKPRVCLAADITCNDQYLGQIAEGLVDVLKDDTSW